MSVFKYMTGAATIRFLTSWALRITPPAEFNDPFELRPPVPRLFTQEYVATEFRASAPERAVDELTEQLLPTFAGRLSRSDVRELCRSFVAPLGFVAQSRLIAKLSKKIPGFSRHAFSQLQRQAQQTFPALIESAGIYASQMLPVVNEAIRHGLTEKVPAKLGVLCLTRNGNQPLMWAHYADSHRGALVEFDESHPTFSRRRTSEDELGYLRSVVYSLKRPELTMESVDAERAFEVFALTKSEHWAYEDEVRLLWPLAAADRTINSDGTAVALLRVPPDAVRSITFGCKMPDSLHSEVKAALRGPDSRHILLGRAKLHELNFDLVYEPFL